MSDAATGWFARNLAIAGFSEHTAAFTTCKELIDNAVDASRVSGGHKVNLILEQLTPDLVKISCEDWGTGFSQANLDSLSDLFNSTKVDDCISAGKFGIGLKLILLSSIKLTGQPVEITGLDFSVILTLTNSKIDFVEFRHFSPAPDSPSTRITVFSNSADPEDLKFRVSSYLSELAQSFPTWKFLLSGAAIERHAGEVVEFQDTRFLCSLEILPGCPEKKKFEIVRLINSTPLIFNGAECALLSGAIAGLAQSAPSLGVSDLSNPGVSRSSQAELGCQGLGAWGRLRLRVDVSLTAEACEYASLAKTALAPNPDLAAGVTRAVSKTLARAKRRWPAQLKSLADAGRQAALKIHIPALAESLAGIFGRAKSSEVRQKVEELMGFGNLAGVEFEEALVLRITARLKSGLRKTKL